MINWIKNKHKALVNYFDVKHSSQFNFDKHIIAIGFRLVSEKNDLKLYVNNYDGIKLNLIINLKKKGILISSGGDILCKLNFIPSGSLFSDMIITQTLNSVKELYVAQE